MLSFRRKAVNAVMLTLTGVCASVAVSVLLFILGYLFVHGGTSVDLNFFTKLPVPPGETGGGMANALLGSAKLVLLATLIGVPIGFLGGVYLAEFGRSVFSDVVRYTADLLNGVPSIIIGVFIYTLVVLPRGHFAPTVFGHTLFDLPYGGFSTLAGGVALGVMMIPISIRSAEEFLRNVPLSLREGAMALGASKAKTILTVVIPAAKAGLITGIMLNIARVAGESAPLMLTAFDNQYWSKGWGNPTASLPVMVYKYATSPNEDWNKQAWSAGFVLLMLVLTINVIARTIVSTKGKVAR